MKILQANAGALTNYEVLDFLRSRGAKKDATRVLLPIAPSEFKVFDYLEESAAGCQNREIIDTFLEKCKRFNLSKAEILNILNVRPASTPEIYPIIEQYDERFGQDEETMEQFVEMIIDVLPAPLVPMQTDDQVDDEKETAADAEKETAAVTDADASAEKETAADADADLVRLTNIIVASVSMQPDDEVDAEK